MACTKEQLEGLVCKFERCAERQIANRHSAVKLRAAERDLLAVGEEFRDFGIAAVKGNKDLLNEVFGGACEHIGRMYIVFDSVTLSDMHAGDQRWEGCKKQLDIIKKILLDLGSFKPWTVGIVKLESLAYPGLRPRFSPGERLDIHPCIVGPAPLYFKVQPLLPDSLRVNITTGVISGILKSDVEHLERIYTVTAGKDAVEVSVDLKFAVCMPPPNTPRYPCGLESLFMAEHVQLSPIIEGSVVHRWRVDPPLPAGLHLDPESGTISGAPHDVAVPAEYTVSAMNTGGEANVELLIGVKVAPPCALSYPHAQEEYPQGVVMYLVPSMEFEKSDHASEKKTDSRKVSAAPPAHRKSRILTGTNMLDAGPRASIFHAGVASGVCFAVEPPLPEGLELTTMGIITGRAVHPTEAAIYTITATNDGGKVQTQLPLGIHLVPPSNLCYPEIGTVYYVGEPISLAPAVDGLVTEWWLEPWELPPDLYFDEWTGTISGIPTSVSECSVQVSAWNEAGGAYFDVGFNVKCPPPSALEYPSLQAVYPCLRDIMVCPTVVGTVDEFSLTTPLPDGLHFDTVTGVIQGTPTQVIGNATYEVVAKNASGSTSILLEFSVQLMPPEALGYPGVDELYFVYEDIELQPSVDGWATTWSVEPSLPAGLTLDEASGRISGSPSETAAEAAYTVTASNEAGGTSAVLVFMITANEPYGLSYPMATGDYTTNRHVLLEPQLECGVCGIFTVVPCLPEGLVLDSKSGIISGEPNTRSDPTTYTVTVSNIAGACSTELIIGVSDIPSVTDATETFASMVERVTDLVELRKMDPSKKRAAGDWMLWMVHRAWLNDPELTIFDFDNLVMPLPHQEPRIAPKLMKAMAHNTVITQLHLNNSNLQKPQGHMLAQSLRENKTLLVLGIETNNLDSAAIMDLAVALKESEVSCLQQFRFSCQICVKGSLGRPVEQALAEMMEVNRKILKLGVDLHDPHWNNKINGYVMRNNDIFRRMRKGRCTIVHNVVPAVLKSVSKIVLVEVPGRAMWEIFDTEDSHMWVICNGVATSRRMPTREQVQVMARTAGVPLKFSEVAPLLREFRKTLLDAIIDTRIAAFDLYQSESSGVLVSWSEANDKWTFDFWPSQTERFNLTAEKQPVIELSESLAEWLWIE